MATISIRNLIHELNLKLVGDKENLQDGSPAIEAGRH